MYVQCANGASYIMNYYFYLKNKEILGCTVAQFPTDTLTCITEQ